MLYFIFSKFSNNILCKIKCFFNFRMNIEELLEIYGNRFDRATHGDTVILRAAYKHLNIFMEITNNSKIYHWMQIVINLYCNK